MKKRLKVELKGNTMLSDGVYYDIEDKVEALRDCKVIEYRTPDAAPLLDLHRAPNEMRSREAETEGSDRIQAAR